MVRTLSTMMDLGALAPNFTLTDTVSGTLIARDDVAGTKGLLVMFICRHCPYVKHVQEEIAQLGNKYESQNIGIVAISSNDPDGYPDDSAPYLREQAETLGFSFPYLLDDTQDVAKAYGAACTPDFFLFDAGHALVYRGQLDDSRPGTEIPVTGKDLRAAMDALLAGSPVSADQKPSMGCNIKWKPDNAPDYFTRPGK